MTFPNPARVFRQSIPLHLLALAAFTSALFLPWIGRGFIHDDFVHLLSASRESLRVGLTTAPDGPFYAPVAWLTFRFDWFLWGENAFPMAAENLLLHIANQFLIYFLVLRLWESRTAAFWAAFGFSLLFPANIWAVLWISTRAHLLSAAFYLSAMLSLLWMRKRPVLAAMGVVVFGALAIFSKESGVTVPMALILLAVYERRAGKQVKPVQTLAVLIAVSAVAGLYVWMRASSGAVPLTFSVEFGYSYAPSLAVLWSNTLEYAWRTLGLLAGLAIALALSGRLGGGIANFALLTRNEILFCIAFYGVAISPFILLSARSGIYSYLPGAAAALLLGVVVRSFHQPVSRVRFSVALPVLLVVAVYSAFIVGQSRKWIHTATTTTVVLDQISTEEPHPPPGTFFVLTYPGLDNTNRFPHGFDVWGFPPALRLHYSEPSLDGAIVREGEPYVPQEGRPEIRFAYTSENGQIRIVRIR